MFLMIVLCNVVAFPFARPFSIDAHPAGPAGVVNGRPRQVTV
jgi:hypothetical protein